MGPRKKSVMMTATLADMVNNAFADIEGLRDELQDLHDNLPENLWNGDKGERLQEAISQLESQSAPDVPAAAEDLTMKYGEASGRLNRNDRCGNACALVSAAADAARTRAGELSTTEEDDDLQAELEELADALEEVEMEWSNVKFPEIYG